MTGFEPSQRLWDAVEFAAAAHRGQVRKGTGVPYLVHPLGVMQILIEHGASEPVAVAGVLHDVLEDTEATFSELETEFGAEVAELVKSLSEPDKGASWEDRKKHTIEFLEEAPTEVLLAACADKFDNLRSLEADLAVQGEALWERFKRGREQQAWYYQNLARVFSHRSRSQILFQSFAKLVALVFPK